MSEQLQSLRSWWQLFDYCFNHNPSAISCESFWANAIGAFIAFGVAMVSIGIWRAIDYRRKVTRAAIAEWERNSVDEAGIREVTWKGEAAGVTDAPDDELIEKIRAGVEQRKREVAASIVEPARRSGA